MAVGCGVVLLDVAFRTDFLEAGLHTSAMWVRAAVVLFGLAWLVQARWIGRELE